MIKHCGYNAMFFSIYAVICTVVLFAITLVSCSTTLYTGDVVAVSQYDQYNGKQATGIHQLTYQSKYQSFSANELTVLPQQNTYWVWIAGSLDPNSGNYDLIGINTHDYYNGVYATGIHVIDASTGYTSYKYQGLSILGTTDPNTWAFIPGSSNTNGLPDIIAINRYDSWNGKTGTGVHILSGSNNYQTWGAFNTLSVLGQTNLHDWQFVAGTDNSAGKHLPDIIAVNMHDQNNLVGIHILSGVSNYQSYTTQVLSNMPWVYDTQWAFVSGLQQPGQFRDVIGINMQDENGKTGIYTFSASTNYQVSYPGTLSVLGTTSTSQGWHFAPTPPTSPTSICANGLPLNDYFTGTNCGTCDATVCPAGTSCNTNGKGGCVNLTDYCPPDSGKCSQRNPGFVCYKDSTQKTYRCACSDGYDLGVSVGNTVHNCGSCGVKCTSPQQCIGTFTLTGTPYCETVKVNTTAT